MCGLFSFKSIGKNMIKKITFCFVALIGLTHSAFAGVQEELIELRSQVQLEADSLEAEKKSINASIQSLTVEKGELESQKKLLTQANRQYALSLNEKTKIMGGEDLKDFAGYAEMANLGTQTLNSYFETAVPFKVDERKERLLKLKEKFDSKELTVAEYFEKYWSILQDEIRLSENVEVQNDTIQIEGVDHKVKVLKLGMFGLYFKSLDGRVGYASRENNDWSFKFFEKSSDSKNVALLFSAKEQQIKGGKYQLPLVIPNYASKEVKNVL
jgi:hypothetical protein